jgi:hypothetical protein
MDVWSLGVILYELISGQHLFNQDLNNDSLISMSDKVQLCAWIALPDTHVSELYRLMDLAGVPFRAADAVVELLRWCLQGDPAKRPALLDVRNHLFFRATSTGSDTTNAEVSVRLANNHFFWSHMQAEASGIVGTLCSLATRFGAQSWRDMMSDVLTEEAMREGVLGASVFVFLLTNKSLSRAFCIKEITWAMEAEKPIVFVVEKDERFHPFCYDRWLEDTLDWDATERKWVTSEDLGVPFNACPQPVKELVKQHYKNNKLVPYRRRDFEAVAMMGAIFQRAFSSGQSWGCLPDQANPALAAAVPDALRDVMVIMCTGEEEATACHQTRDSIQMITNGMTTLTNYNDWNLEDKLPSHALLLLSKGIMSWDAGVVGALLKCTSSRIGVVCVYLDSWNFGSFYASSGSCQEVKEIIGGHEALVYRKADEQAGYEHRAMVLEILRRFRVKSGGRRKGSTQ